MLPIYIQFVAKSGALYGSLCLAVFYPSLQYFSSLKYEFFLLKIQS
jgi:hypothetical protein